MKISGFIPHFTQLRKEAWKASISAGICGTIARRLIKVSSWAVVET
jgi:hypothetical protein